MNRFPARILILSLSLALFSPGPLRVRAADRALDIMREVDHRQRSESRSNDGAVEVIDNKGKVRHKSWHFWAAGHRGESKVLIRFAAPPEVQGVGLLTLNHPTKPAEQWLYTPSIQRDRRITSQEKSARFMGTDFTNEDMEERGVEDYDYDLMEEEVFAGQPAYKIKAVYQDQDNTQYSHLFLWVQKDIMATTFMEFYIDGKLRKTLLWSDWKQIQGIWTAHVLEMKDLARESTTRIRISNVKYNVKFEPNWFSLRNLRRTF